MIHNIKFRAFVYEDESVDEISSYWQANKQYEAMMSKEQREHLYKGWQKAIEAARLFK